MSQYRDVCRRLNAQRKQAPLDGVRTAPEEVRARLLKTREDIAKRMAQPKTLPPRFRGQPDHAPVSGDEEVTPEEQARLLELKLATEQRIKAYAERQRLLPKGDGQ